MNRHTSTFARRSLSGLVCLTLAVSACGGTSSSDEGGVPTLAPATTTAAPEQGSPNDDVPSDAPDADATPQERAVALAECMRDNGVEEFPDPEFDDQGNPELQAPPDDPDLMPALQTCTELTGSLSGSGPTDEQIADAQRRAMELTECMREHGFEFADPIVGDDGIIQMRPADDIDRSSTSFAEAEASCGGALAQATGR